MTSSTINLTKFSIFVVSICLLTSCYTQRDKRFWQDSPTLPQYEIVKYQPYKININDELFFRVITTDKKFVNIIGVGNNSTQNVISYRVYPDGTIDIPFVESIKVAGLSIEEASRVIEKKLLEIIPDAEVKLTLKNKNYTVIGDAGKGIFPVYKDRLNIYQALAQSGEIMLSGDRRHIKIIRETYGKQPKILEFDIRSNSVIDSEYYYIFPNDIIYVQREKASFYKADGYSALIGLLTSSVSFFTNIYYYTKYNK